MARRGGAGWKGLEGAAVTPGPGSERSSWIRSSLKTGGAGPARRAPARTHTRRRAPPPLSFGNATLGSRTAGAGTSSCLVLEHQVPRGRAARAAQPQAQREQRGRHQAQLRPRHLLRLKWSGRAHPWVSTISGLHSSCTLRGRWLAGLTQRCASTPWPLLLAPATPQPWLLSDRSSGQGRRAAPARCHHCSAISHATPPAAAFYEELPSCAVHAARAVRAAHSARAVSSPAARVAACRWPPGRRCRRRAAPSRCTMGRSPLGIGWPTHTCRPEKGSSSGGGGGGGGGGSSEECCCCRRRTLLLRRA